MHFFYFNFHCILNRLAPLNTNDSNGGTEWLSIVVCCGKGECRDQCKDVPKDTYTGANAQMGWKWSIPLAASKTYWVLAQCSGCTGEERNIAGSVHVWVSFPCVLWFLVKHFAGRGERFTHCFFQCVVPGQRHHSMCLCGREVNFQLVLNYIFCWEPLYNYLYLTVEKVFYVSLESARCFHICNILA